MRPCLPRLPLFPTLCLIITAYFVYHTVYGARGYRRLHQVRTEIAQDSRLAEQIHTRRLTLERKVDSLSAESLDMDQLEESALRILNMGSADDQIILLR